MRPAAAGPRRPRRDSTRRISAIAASPTSSCSAVGSLVAQWRWISRPGVWKASASGSPWWRSDQANISTASEAPPRPTPARSAAPGSSTRRSSSDGAGGGEQHHRHDQVGAAAVVLFGHAGDVGDPLLVGGDRLVLDAVVGGEVAVHQGDQRRHRADRLHQPLAQRAGAQGAAQQPGQPPASRRPRRAPAGPRTAAAPTAAAAAPAAAPPSPRPVSPARAARARGRPGPAPAPACAPRRPRSGRRRSRTAAAQWVGPWISSPLRSAIPPSRSGSRFSFSPVPFSLIPETIRGAGVPSAELLRFVTQRVTNLNRSSGVGRRGTLRGRRAQSISAPSPPCVNPRPETPSPGPRPELSALPGSSLECRP